MVRDVEINLVKAAAAAAVEVVRGVRQRVRTAAANPRRER